MNTIASIAPVGKPARSITQFIERLDTLAIPAMPVKGDEMNSRAGMTVRYYHLEVGDFVESPWVTVTEHAGSITATVSGADDVVLLTPEQAFGALKADCRARLSDAGIDPAF